MRSAARGADLVFHLAFVYGRAWAANQELLGPNVRATATVLKASVDAGARRLVLSGSVSVYGWAHPMSEWPLTEDATALTGVGAYAETKLTSERLVRECTQRFGLEHAILRIPHVYGTGATTFEYFIDRLLPPAVPRRPVERVVDPTLLRGRIWQLIHVSDVADGIVRAGARPGGRNATLNIAGKAATTRAQLRRIVRDCVQRSSPHRGEWLAPPSLQLFDIGKAQRLVGFVPRVSVQDGVSGVVEGLLAGGGNGGQHERN
jgi:nucleoside-diphosphate-sugar epimerase